MNTITIIGNVGQDPELRFTKSGKPVVKFSVADTRGKDESKQTQWHRITAFDEQAENVAEQIRKGSRVVVIGRLQIDKYTDISGTEKISYEIIADDVCLSLRWKPRANDTVAQAVRALGATEVYDPSEDPF